MANKIKIGSNGKVNIKWQVLPIDYSHDEEKNICVKFARKYGISKDNVKVEPIFVVKNADGTLLPYKNDITCNIQDSNFQRQLFKEYLKEHDITDYDFDEISKIDDDINSQIDYTLYEQNKRYSINWIKWSNFMSYGENNYFDFRTIDGLVLLTSEPANQGGKTTFCLDLLRFLLFGKVTSRENDWVLSRVFNKHLPEATEVIVEGCVTIDGCDYVIKRTVTRPALKKRTEKSKVSQKVDYYKLVNNEYIDLVDEECENESSVTETNKAIKDAIGNERDFDLMICVDADNLKDLISLKDTDRGRLISRWIGLLALEDKDKIAREKFNKEIVPTLVMNKYNKEELRNDIILLTENNKQLDEQDKINEEKLIESDKKLVEFNNTRDTLMQSKRNVDESLLKIDIKTLETSLESIKNDGVIKRQQLNNNKKLFNEIGEVNFNENDYKMLQQNERDLTETIATLKVNYLSTEKEIDTLQKGEYCPTCGAKLKGVDNTQKINELKEKLEKIKIEGIAIKEKKEKLIKNIENLEENRKKYEEKCKLQLVIDKNEVDIENLIHRFKECERQLKNIQDNKEAIENNNKIEVSLNIINENIKQETTYQQKLKEEILSNKATIEANKKVIEKSNEFVKTIEKEEILIRNWRIYLDMIGKNGISKMVIRTVLPLINGELKHLLSDVCDFDVEVSIDEHNDVAFNLIHDGIKSALGSGSGFEQTVSSLALRTVLSKISSFSKPSFVVFDEILGGVAAENYDSLKKLYDKMVLSYGTILEITHNPALVEWHKYFVTIKKQNNISSIGIIS